MYAIVKVGGKQYRAERGATLLVDRLPADEGTKVALRPVMFRGDDVVVGSSELEKVGRTSADAVIVGNGAETEESPSEDGEVKPRRRGRRGGRGRRKAPATQADE